MAGADDVVARLGGDEFAVLLQCPQGLAQALDFGQRLLLALQESMWIAGRELFPSGSLGIALWNPRYRTGEELLRDADADRMLVEVAKRIVSMAGADDVVARLGGDEFAVLL
ncbi:hypothetical protein C7E23_18120, partial [Elizabethkingia anophelis]